MDLLRACQREGLVRVERDRRGGLRVFPGQALQRTEPPHTDAAPEPSESQQQRSRPSPAKTAEAEQAEPEPIPIDTTAELLGRAKPRRPRATFDVRGGSSPGTAWRAQGRGAETGGAPPRTREESHAGRPADDTES